MAARASGSATISFGLVSIPIKLYTATAPQSVSFNMLHKKCKSRIKMQLFCPLDNEVVDRRDTVKGYEYGKDQYVVFEPEELQKLEAEKTDRLDIVEFVPTDSVDLVYIESSHYLGPGKGGDRAYKLLGEAMERMDRMAVGRFYSHGKTNLVLLRPYKGGIIMHHVYYADEVRSMDDVEYPGKLEFRPVEEELADKLIEQLSVDAFKPEQYHDEYKDRVLSAVEQKIAGQEVSVPTEAPAAPIVDLFEALKKSLEGVNAGPASRPANEQQRPAEPEPAEADAKPIKKVVAKKPAREKKPATG
ncbi:MAG TPA: Ku protein [Minicystis sp.]|nr:Ku protein [Minicystis sp.]